MGGMTSVVSRAATLVSRILLLHIFVLSGGAGRSAMQVCFENKASSPFKSLPADVLW